VLIRFLVVHAAGRQVGLPVEHLEAVTAAPLSVQVPTREPAVRGVATVRGRVVPVVHLGALLDGTGCPADVADAAVVVNVDARQFCLEVDGADAVQAGQLMPVPRDRAVPWAWALVKREDDTLPLLDLAALSTRLTETGRT
jgi:purine-binding chemotaxis protein CheW